MTIYIVCCSQHSHQKKKANTGTNVISTIHTSSSRLFFPQLPQLPCQLSMPWGVSRPSPYVFCFVVVLLFVCFCFDLQKELPVFFFLLYSRRVRTKHTTQEEEEVVVARPQRFRSLFVLFFTFFHLTPKRKTKPTTRDPVRFPLQIYKQMTNLAMFQHKGAKSRICCCSCSAAAANSFLVVVL